jgi:hypothetical protein
MLVLRLYLKMESGDGKGQIVQEEQTRLKDVCASMTSKYDNGPILAPRRNCTLEDPFCPKMLARK